MHGMQYDELDWNLLKTLHALLETSSVRDAADRIGRSAPATSHALARLRDALDDPILVRAGRGMVRTARAEAMRPDVARLVESIGEVLRPSRPVDPATLQARFRIRATDHVLGVLGPSLDARIRAAAPHVDLVVTPNRDDDADHLREGRVDLAVGVWADLPPELRIRRLFADRFVCVVREDHPRRATVDQMATWLDLDHVLTAPRGRPGSHVDRHLRALGHQRRVARTVPYFLAAFLLVAQSDAVLTVSARLARTMAPRFGLHVFAPPLDLGPDYTLSMLWHPRRDGDPAHRWLRDQLVAASMELPSLSEPAA